MNAANHAQERSGRWSRTTRIRLWFVGALLLSLAMVSCDRDGSAGPQDAGPDAKDADGPDADVVDALPACFDGIVEEDLPARVVFRSKFTSFNRRWVVALHEGLIWVKPNDEAGQPPGDWRLLGTGLPAGADVRRFEPPTEIVELSADGTWLHALSSAGVFYRGTDFTGDVHASFTWSDAWGHPGATGPGITTEFPTTFGWSVSDSQASGVHHYEDRLGTVHSVGLGVAHLYRLGPDGRTLIFNDWWLPADWSRQICLPERGTFPAQNVSASASTVFVVGPSGELYTRLYDFDTGGENNTLVYSFLISTPTGDTRALPAENWLRQPDITDGWITSRITIFQDGQGNAARVLRVEGVRDGRGGFFHKRISDPTWSFEETGHRVCGPFLNAPDRLPPEPRDPDDHPLIGTLTRSPTFGTGASITIELGFNLMCSPAEVFFIMDGRVITAGGAPLTFPFHHVHDLILETRPREYWLQGLPATIRAALLVPDGALTLVDDPGDRELLGRLFEDRRVVNFQGTATPWQLDLTEMTWLDPAVGVVPGDEKADPGNVLTLQANH